MKQTSLVVACFIAFSGAAQGRVAQGGQTLYIYPTATPAESRQVEGIRNLMDHDELAARWRLLEVLGSHPHNRLARMMMARVEWLQGRPSQAEAWLAPLLDCAQPFGPANSLHREMQQAKDRLR